MTNAAAAAASTNFTRTAFGVTAAEGCTDGMAMLAAAGGDFTIEKRQVSYPVTKTVSVGVDDTITQTEWVDIDAFAAIRSDTQESVSDSTVGAGYVLVQNSEVIDIVDAICEGHGLTYDYMTLMGRGKGLAVQVSCPNLADALTVAGDAHDGRLTIVNTHDGSGSLKAHVSLLRLFCANVLPAINREHREAKKDGKAVYSLRHSRNIESRINEMISTYRAAMGDMVDTADTLRLLASKPCTKAEQAELFKRLMIADGKDEKDLSKRAIARRDNQIRTLNDYALAPVNQAQGAAGTWYEALQPVTAFATRGIGTRDTGNACEAERRYTSANFGAGAAFARRGLALAMEMAGV
jgi:hypothetical protein